MNTKYRYMSAHELIFTERPPLQNKVTGCYMKGHVPFNKGRKWSEYMSKRSQRRCSRGWIDIDVFRNKGAVAEGNYTRTDRPVLVKTSNGKYAIAHRREFLDHSWTWSGSGTFDSSVTHWRQIELK